MAAETGNVAAIEALLDFGADIESVSSLGWKPLHYAARNGTVEGILTFLESGADLEAPAASGKLGAPRPEAGSGPLHFADRHNLIDRVLALLEVNADPSSIDGNGDTFRVLAMRNMRISYRKWGEIYFHTRK